MHASLINPYIRVAMRSELSAGHHICRRVIYDYELIYLERGKFTLFYNDVPFLCQEGDLIFIRPGIPHSFQVDRGEISQPHIHFDLTYRPQSEEIPVSFKDSESMTEMEKSRIHKDPFPPSDSPFLRIGSKEEFLALFYRIIAKDTAPLIKKALMIQLISMIINDHFPDMLEEQECTPVEIQIRDYLESGNGDTVSLDDLAKRFFHSKFYLEKKFKRAFGVSIIEYRNRQRMARADSLLEHHSVSRVAEALGYQSIYSFSRAYKQHFGISPGKRR